MKINHIFFEACTNGNLDQVKSLLATKILKDHADIHAKNDCALRWAFENDHRDIIEFVINETDIYGIDEVRSLGLEDEDGVEEIIEMIKARDLKNQLSNEVLSKNSISEKSRYLI